MKDSSKKKEIIKITHKKNTNKHISQVLGFIIDEFSQEIYLVQKKSPEWQSGKLNGIGGTVMNGESPHEAMERLAKSRVKYDGNWHENACIVRSDWICNVYFSIADKNHFPISHTENIVGTFAFGDLPYLPKNMPLVTGVELLIHTALIKFRDKNTPYVIIQMDDNIPSPQAVGLYHQQ